MELESIENALTDWLNSTKYLNQKIVSISELQDGINLTKILNSIDKIIFDESKMIQDSQKNWALIHQNLTILMENIKIYFSNFLSKTFDKNAVDLMEISQNCNKQQLINLLALVIEILINSDHREEILKTIMEMSQQHQIVMMNILQKSQETISDQSNISSIENFIQTSQFNSFSHQDKQILLNNIAELEEDKQTFLAKINEISKECLLKQAKIDEINKEFQILQNNYEKLVISNENSLKNLGADSESDVKLIFAVKDQKIKDLQNYIQEIQQNNEKELRIQQHENEILLKKVNQHKRAEEQLIFFKEKYQDYQHQLENNQDQQKQIQIYKSQVEEKERQLDQANQKLSQIKEKLSSEKQTIIDVTLQIEQKQMKLEQLQFKYQQTQEKLTEQEFFNKQLKDLIEHKTNEEETVNKNNFKSFENNLSLDMGSCVEEKDREIALLKMELAEQKAFSHKVDIEIFKEEIQMLKLNLKKIQNENLELKQEKQNFETVDIENLQNQIQQLKLENQKLLETNLKLKQQKDKDFNSSNNNNNIFDQAQINKEAMQNKENQLKELHQKLEEKSKIILELKQTNTKDQQELKQNEMEKQEILIKFQQEQNLNSQLKTQLKELNSQIAKQNQTQSNQLQENCSQLEQENRELREKFIDLNNSNNQEILMVSQVLQDLRQKFEELQSKKQRNV